MKRIIRYFTLRGRLKKAIIREEENKSLCRGLMNNATKESSCQHFASLWEHHANTLRELKKLL